jgi:hypothetical protein
MLPPMNSKAIMWRWASTKPRASPYGVAPVYGPPVAFTCASGYSGQPCAVSKLNSAASPEPPRMTWPVGLTESALPEEIEVTLKAPPSTVTSHSAASLGALAVCAVSPEPATRKSLSLP